MKPFRPIALLGAPARAAALRERLATHPIGWTDAPRADCLNLLLDADDLVWRQRLEHDRLAFQVGRDDVQALRAIGSWLGEALVETDESLRLGRGRWTCESCSDPQCEHRLFQDLLARRG